MIVSAYAGVTALRSKSPDAQLRGVSIGIIFGVVVQGVLGFVTLDLAGDVLAWVHLILGVLIYAMALTGMSFAQRQEYMSAPKPAV